MASIARSTANRAVHMRINPRPSNLGESREILRFISQFGEVEYFKHLKHHANPAPNSAIVIFRDEDAATQCLNKSPIRFRMGNASLEDTSDPPSQATAESERKSTDFEAHPQTNAFRSNFSQTRATSASTLPEPPPRPIPMPFQPPRPRSLEPRIFQIQAQRAQVHFRDQIDSKEYHGHFTLDNRGIPQLDLVKSVPVPGLSCVDWGASKPWRFARREKQMERPGLNEKKTLRELYDDASKEDAASSESL